MEPTKNFDPANLQIWRESLAHLRHLSDEVWKRFQLFLALDFLLFFVAASQWRRSFGGCFVALILALGVASIGRYILKRNRIYYLQMLAKKSLIEDEIGFYSTKFPATEIDYAFPWRITPDAVSEIKKDCDSWIQKSIRAQGTITFWQFLIFEIFIAVFGIALFLDIIRMFQNL